MLEGLSFASPDALENLFQLAMSYSSDELVPILSPLIKHLVSFRHSAGSIVSYY